MTFRLGDQLYAIEHTGIEPFDGFMEHQNRAPSLFTPLEAEITSALSAMLTPGVVIEMLMPIDAFNGYKMPDVRAIHSALVDWVRVTAPTLPPRMYADHRRMVTEEHAGVPFSVSRNRALFRKSHILRVGGRPADSREQQDGKHRDGVNSLHGQPPFGLVVGAF
jgi:hypothetical protein